MNWLTELPTGVPDLILKYSKQVSFHKISPSQGINTCLWPLLLLPALHLI